MFKAAFNTFVYEPLYNGLIYLVDILPGHDVGLAVIGLTILVKFVLFPLSRQAIRTQIAMRAIAPEIEEIRKKYADKQDEQARAIFALYRERGVRPFSSFLLILVQFPILFGLYWVFWRGGLPDVNTALLYSFVPVPPVVDMDFLGIFNMSERSVVLAVTAGLTQLVYARLSMGPRKPRDASQEPSFSADMAHSFDLQARYILPVIIAVIGYSVSAAVALYWTTSNLFMIGQELFMGRRFADAGEEKSSTPGSPKPSKELQK